LRVSQASGLAHALKRGLIHEGVSLIEVEVDLAVPLLYAQKS
jgi:benzoylformate decarboxylase